MNLPYIFVRVIQHWNGLLYIHFTSALIFCISTSSNFVFTNFNLTSPVSIIFNMSFFALKSGINYFLFPVVLNAGTFYCILSSIWFKSLFLEFMKFLMVSLAFFNLNFTSSTFYIGFRTGIFYWIPSFLDSPKQKLPIHYLLIVCINYSLINNQNVRIFITMAGIHVPMDKILFQNPWRVANLWTDKIINIRENSP